MKRFEKILTELSGHLSTETKQVDLKKQIIEAIGKRHYQRIVMNVERLGEDDKRKLRLVHRALESEAKPDALFNTKTHYLQKRYND